MKQNTIGRRDFLRTSGEYALAAAVALPVLSTIAEAKDKDAAMQPITIDLSSDEFAGLKAIGGAVKIPDPNDKKHPVIVTHVSENEYAAFSSRCTHWGCEVELPVNSVILCKCHKSTFDMNGSVTHGPARKNLIKFDTVNKDGILTIREAAP